MIRISIPDYGDIDLKYVVCDYNGTLALDGVLIEGVPDLLRSLSHRIEIHVITADTFGRAKAQLGDLPVTLIITPPEHQADSKLDYIRKLGTANVVAIGNGRNDRKMLKDAALGITLIQKEGASAETLCSADIVSRCIIEALDFLNNPKRLKATLRS